MQRAAMMNRRASGTERTWHRLRSVERRNALQSRHARIVVRRAMLEHRSAVSPGNVLHAAILRHRLLERHPDADLLVIHARIIAVRLILMPWRCRTKMRRFI